MIGMLYSKTVTSNVPPPKSKTNVLPDCSSCNPYAMAAAVGSLIKRTAFKPASSAAKRVCLRCSSLK